MVEASLRVKAVGASGSTSAMGIDTAVLSFEVADSPRLLIAVTLVITSAESARSKGVTLRSPIRTVHSVAVMIVPSFSASQLFVSIVNVDVEVLISSLYPLIEMPPSSEGGFQSMVKDVSPFRVKVGGLG